MGYCFIKKRDKDGPIFVSKAFHEGDLSIYTLTEYRNIVQRIRFNGASHIIVNRDGNRNQNLAEKNRTPSANIMGILFLF